MKLSELLKNVKIVKNTNEDIEIDELTYDSRKISDNTLFFCLKGENTDGHNYAKDAEFNGVKAIVCEKELDVKIPQIIVKDSRKALSICCGNYYNNPCKELKMVAVVGTNGKTTTTFLIKSILEKSNKKVGLIGTQGAFIGEQFVEIGMTTPDPQVLHKVLREMVDLGMEYVVMEASAHALALEKLEGIIFQVAVFTNFTQDHLDYFKTMENYKQAKLKLFDSKHILSAVLNFDDPVGIEIANKLPIPMVSYALHNPGDVFALDIVKKSSKTEYVINLLDNVFAVNSNLLGEFNVYNSLSAATACALLGCSEKSIRAGLESLQGVPGRLSSIKLSNGATAIIDFAHTPDGIEKVLTAINELPFKRIITVFGCGGNRDKGKRPQMGKIAEKLSDFVIISSDNPRFENPELIINDIENGMKKNAHTRIVDRRTAVIYAIEMAREGDAVAICGKGAEEYQDINGVKSPYNDYEVVMLKNEEMKIEKAVLGE